MNRELIQQIARESYAAVRRDEDPNWQFNPASERILGEMQGIFERFALELYKAVRHGQFPVDPKTLG